MNEFPKGSEHSEGVVPPDIAPTGQVREARAHRFQRYVIGACILFWFLVIRWAIFYLAEDWKLFPAIMPGLLPLVLVWWACMRAIGATCRDRSLKQAWWIASVASIAGITLVVQTIYHFWPYEKRPGQNYAYSIPATAVQPTSPPSDSPSPEPVPATASAPVGTKPIEVPNVASEVAPSSNPPSENTTPQPSVEVSSDSIETAPAPETQTTRPLRGSVQRRPVGVAGGLYAGSLGGHWIQSVGDEGRIIVLEDGSVWEVSAVDRVDTALWLASDDVTITEDNSGMYDYKLVHTEDGETAEARLLRH